MIQLPVNEAIVHAARYLQTLGASEPDALLVAQSLISADLRGHPSHGLMRLQEYARAIERSFICPQASPAFSWIRPGLLHVQAGRAFGQVAVMRAIETAEPVARELGICAAAVQRCGHAGRLGWYAEAAAARGLAILLAANGGAESPRMAVWGGRRPVFGTNPLCIGFPIPGSHPFVADFSTSAVAAGKIRLARARGETIPEGWILDQNGNPSTDPSDYGAGGMLLPFGAHKGSALAFAVEIFAGLLSGTGALALTEGGLPTQNGIFLLLLHPEALCPEAPTQAAQLLEKARQSGSQVITPGEAEAQAQASAQGTIALSTELAELLGLSQVKVP